MPDFQCRPGCGACCEAISISSPIPGLPDGKPAGLPCPHLSKDKLCLIYGKPERPAVCDGLTASKEMCGNNRDDAFKYLKELEILTAPDRSLLKDL